MNRALLFFWRWWRNNSQPPVSPGSALMLEDGTSYILLEDGVSRILLEF